MKNLGIKLSNNELLNLKGGDWFTCHCNNTGLEYMVDVAGSDVALAEATLASHCNGGSGFCEADIPN